MGADMFTTYVASIPKAELDWDAGTAALNEVVDPAEFGWDPFDLESQDEFLDEDGEVVDEHSSKMTDLATLKKYGLRVLTELKGALEGSGTTLLTIGGYWIYLAGGLSSGDGPCDEYDAICTSNGLPDRVLKAVGFVIKPEDPPSRRAGAQGDVTDVDVVDAIALGLGTKSEWEGADEVTWIANTIAKVRPHPGNIDPVDYYEDFAGRTGFDPLEDRFLNQYVGEETAGDDHQDEEKDG